VQAATLVRQSAESQELILLYRFLDWFGALEQEPDAGVEW